MASIPRLKDFIGQKPLINQLIDEVDAAKFNTKDPLPHCLFSGPCGLGKSLLSAVLANELGVESKEILGNGVNTLSLTEFICSTDASGYDSEGILVNPKERKPSIRIFNECERIKTEILETCHGVLECDVHGNRILPVKIPGQAKMERAWVPDLTTIWITNYTGTFRQRGAGVVSRCQIRYTFQPYDGDELAKIIFHHASKKQIDITEDAVSMISDRALGIPRTAVNLLERCNKRLLAMRARKEVRTTGVNRQIVESCLGLLGIDELGLDVNAVKYLKILADNESAKMGIKTIAAHLGLDSETVQVDIEEYLLRLGLINVIAGGRTITEAGLRHVGLGKSSNVKARVIRKVTNERIATE